MVGGLRRLVSILGAVIASSGIVAYAFDKALSVQLVILSIIFVATFAVIARMIPWRW